MKVQACPFLDARYADMVQKIYPVKSVKLNDKYALTKIGILKKKLFFVPYLGIPFEYSREMNDLLSLSKDQSLDFVIKKVNPSAMDSFFAHYEIDLSSFEADKLSGLVKKNIKKASSQNIIFKTGGIELLLDFFSVYQKRMHELGSPFHSFDFFKSLLTQFKEHCFITVSYKANVPISSLFILHWDQQAINPWAASNIRYSKIQANSFNYFMSLKFLKEQGFKMIDLGRSIINSPHADFKKSWNAREIPSTYHLFSHGEDRLISAYSNLSLLKTISLGWKYTPSALVTKISPHVIPYLPL